MSTPPAAQLQTLKVELRPGAVCEIQVPQGEVPRYCLSKLTRTEGGTYRLAPVEWSAHVRMRQTLTEDLGLPFDKNTLYRLIYAGFIRASQPSPGCFIIDLASVVEHIEATQVRAGEPSFWTLARKERYRTASAESQGRLPSLASLPSAPSP